MAKYSIEDSTLTGIADAIRSKTGDSAEIKVEDMASAVTALPDAGSGGGAVETCTVTCKVMSAVYVWYSDGTSCHRLELNRSGSDSAVVAKNSIFYFESGTYVVDEGLYERMDDYALFIKGDVTMIVG